MKQQKILVPLTIIRCHRDEDIYADFYKHLELLNIPEVYLPPRTIQKKKAILDYREDANFEDFHYFFLWELEEALQIDVKGLFPGENVPKVIKVFKNEIGLGIVTLDSTGDRVIGSRKNPARVEEFLIKGEDIDPCVCYTSTGEPIKEAMEAVVDVFSKEENISELSVVLVYQWAVSNPYTEGRYVKPQCISLRKLKEYVN